IAASGYDRLLTVLCSSHGTVSTCGCEKCHLGLIDSAYGRQNEKKTLQIQGIGQNKKKIEGYSAVGDRPADGFLRRFRGNGPSCIWKFAPKVTHPYSKSAPMALSWHVADDAHHRLSQLFSKLAQALDHLDLSRLQLEIEDREIGPHVVGVRGSGQDDHADLQGEAEDHLRDGPAVSLGDPGHFGTGHHSAIGGQEREALIDQAIGVAKLPDIAIPAADRVAPVL